MWDQCAHIERLASSAMTLLARRVDEAGKWRGEGFRRRPSRSRLTCGNVGVGAAGDARHVQERRRAAEDGAGDARAAGLSAAKAKLVSKAAKVAPGCEDGAVGVGDEGAAGEGAEGGVAGEGVGRYRRHARTDQKERSFREYTDDEGAWVLHARGPVEAGQAFRDAITPIIDRYFKEKRTPKDREPREAYAFDALIELAKRQRPADAEKKSSGRYLGLIRAESKRCSAGTSKATRSARSPGSARSRCASPGSSSATRSCKLVITKGVDVANVTHLGRSSTIAQQVRVVVAFPECTRLGCTRTQRLENDHRHGWTKTHTTRLDESDPLCDHDHDLKTYFGWALVEGTGNVPWSHPTTPTTPRTNRSRVAAGPTSLASRTPTSSISPTTTIL